MAHTELHEGEKTGAIWRRISSVEETQATLLANDARMEAELKNTNSALTALAVKIDQAIDRQRPDVRGMALAVVSVIGLILSFGTLVISNVKDESRTSDENLAILIAGNTSDLVRLDQEMSNSLIRDVQEAKDNQHWHGRVREQLAYLMDRDKYLRESMGDQLTAFDSGIRERVTNNGATKQDLKALEDRLNELTTAFSVLQGENRSQHDNGR